jgi:hypothetical protein
MSDMMRPPSTQMNHYQSMTVDEYAAFEQATTHDHIIQKDGFWWRQVRKGFFRPLFPFFPTSDVLPGNVKPFGVVQYSLMESTRSNSFINILVFDEVDKYDLSTLTGEIRRNIRRAQDRDMTVEQITSPDLFMRQGQAVYQSFIRRTGYVYDQKRLDPSYFKEWINTLFRFPQASIHGVFMEGKLISFIIETLVNDVLVIKTMINGEEALPLHAPDLQLHYARMRAKTQPEIKTIFNGYLLQLPGLNQFKIKRGARIRCLPSRIEAPFPILKMVQIIRPGQYRYLMGFQEHQLAQ